MKRKNNNGILYVVISLLAVFGVGGFIVNAYSGQNNGTVIENQTIQGDYVATSDNGEELFGSVSGPDYYWDYQNFNGLTTYVKTGGFNSATTTLAAIKNPFNTTSTLDLAALEINSGATTTVQYIVTTSTDQFWNGSSSDGALIIAGNDTTKVATSSAAYIENGVTTGVGGSSAGDSSLNKIKILPSEWIIVEAVTINDAYDGAITESTSALKGNYKLRFTR
jgi:hypothetical protein